LSFFLKIAAAFHAIASGAIFGGWSAYATDTATASMVQPRNVVMNR
jgi:hypothetical protein